MIGKIGAILALVIAVLFTAIGKESQYVFTPSVMKQIAQNAIAKSKDPDVIVDHVVKSLQEKYPKYILRPNEKQEWLFNNAGGAMGAMIVLHASLSEYVIIFGTPLGTEGHTGRFLADDYFTILAGEQWAFLPGNLTKEVYRPGDQHHLPYGVAKQYKMPELCWALEYARGNILSMMPFGLFDTFFSTLDLVTLGQTVRISLNLMVRNLLQGKI